MRRAHRSTDGRTATTKAAILVGQFFFQLTMAQSVKSMCTTARVYVCSYHSTMFWDKRSEKFAHTNTRLLKLMYIFILIIILLLLNPLSSFFSLHLTYMSRVILWPRERFLIKQIISARTIAEYWGNGCLL